MKSPARWWVGLSLRARLVTLGTAGMAVGLATGALLLVGVLQYTLQRTLDNSATQTGRDVAALIEADRLPNPVPSGGTAVVQVVDSTGRVRAASATADRLVPVVDEGELAQLRDGQRFYRPGYRVGVDGPVRLVGVPARNGQTVVVAVPAGDLTRIARIVRDALLVGFAVLLAALAALAWRVVGATLRPVEELRAGAEEITGARASARLPVPASRDEIHRLAVTLNGMLGRLDDARQRQRAFVADAAHELRSPLASIRTQLEVAQATSSPADIPDLLLDVDRLVRLVADLLLLARADDAVPVVRPAGAVDLAGLAEAVAQRYATDAVAVTVSGAGTVDGDPDVLRRVLANLVENAVRYARSAVVVTVDGGVVTVTDDGPGIPPDDLDRVFGRFTRLDDARGRDSGGTGLGLAIVRELVRAHGGSVTLTAGDPGLVATVRLPPA